MYLSKMQLLGFKSFPEKTELRFGRGITCIIGPNGCGKTNLLDAIRWVLGETRMSVLRGSRLEEIIFAGTRDYKPLGMAEVLLSFDNHDHAVPSGYDEIDVTRRLFRSGDSEFLINRTPCRLRDITDMFLDTGLGPGAYSVIEQSMVDVLLSDKAEDRRFLFEEAAGITKYKQRKRMALRKLEATESDLLRLRDVLTEVGSQVSMLKKQVSRAERYRSLTDEIKRIGISVSSARYSALGGKEDELADRMHNLRIQAEANSAKQRECELQRERMGIERAELDQQAREFQSGLEEALAGCHKLENDISVLREKVRNAAESFSQAGSDIENLVNRYESLERELEENSGDQKRVDEDISGLNSRLESAETDLEAKSAECAELHKLVDGKQAELDALQKRLVERRESQLSLDLRYDTDSEKLAQIEVEIAGLQSRLDDLSVRQREVAAEVAEVGALILNCDEGIVRARALIEGIEGSIEEIEARKLQDSRELEKVAGRLEFLEKVISDYEGYGKGPAYIGRLRGEIPGIMDAVANLVEVDGRYSSLVQGVLGDYAGYFVVEDGGSASAVLDRIRSEKLGRVGIIVKEMLGNIRIHSDTVAPPGCTPIRSLVSGADELAGLFDFLFDGHYLLDRGAAPRTADFPSAVFWNDQGEMIAYDGMVRSAGLQELILVGRKGELESLASRKTALAGQIYAGDHSRAEMDKKRENLLAELASLESELAGLRARATDLSIRSSNLEYEVAMLKEGKSEREAARTNLGQSIDRVSLDRGELGKELHDLQTRRTGLDREMSEAVERLQAADRDYAASDKENSRLRMELISLESRLDTLRSNRGRLEELRSDVLGTIDTRRSQQSSLLAVSAESRRSIREYEGRLKAGYSDVEEKRSAIVRIGSSMSELDAKIKAVDVDLRSLRHDGAEMIENIHELDLEISSIRSRRSNLVEDSLEHFDFDPSTSSLKVRLPADQLAELDDELSKLRNRREGLGPVNMLALDEFEEQNKRYVFLSHQVEDLTTAKEDLRSTIGRINSTAKKLFTETLQAVRTNFQEVFRELFEGGEADVRLEEDVDPLEANIIITARPRGKKILSIHQLSGGERALTSISLLFSLYLVKPSPFCILDEVDAPLDDANVGRFLKMIRRFSESTQFVIITHNKMTMEEADVLYGVTMSRPGVSQIVSVNLRSADDGSDTQGFTEAAKPEPEEAVEAKS